MDEPLDDDTPEIDISQDGSAAAATGDTSEAAEDEPAIEDLADKSLVASVVAAAAITAAKDELIAEDSSFNNEVSVEDKTKERPDDKPMEIAEPEETENIESNETQDLGEDSNTNQGILFFYIYFPILFEVSLNCDFKQMFRCKRH